MPRRKSRPVNETFLFQFQPELVDVNYDFSSGSRPDRARQFHATQSIDLSGPITYPEKPRQARMALSVYAGSDHLAEREHGEREPIGHFGAHSGVLQGAVWIPDEQFPTLVTLAVSGRLKCVSVHARKGHSRGYMMFNFGVSTRPEI